RARQQRDRGLRAPAARAARGAVHRDAPRPGLRVRRPAVNSLRNRLSLALSLVLLVAAGLLAFGLQDFPRRLVEDFVGSRLQHDADLPYARVPDAPDPDVAAQGAARTVHPLPLSGPLHLRRLR